MATGNVPVSVVAGDTAAAVATKIRDAINNVPASANFSVKASASDTLVNLFGGIAVNPGPLALFTFDALLASQLLDGLTFDVGTLTRTVTFEFDFTGGVAAGNIAVPIATGDTATTVAAKIRRPSTTLYSTTSTSRPAASAALRALTCSAPRPKRRYAPDQA